MALMTLIWPLRRVPSSGLPSLSKLHRGVLIHQPWVFLDMAPRSQLTPMSCLTEEFSEAPDSRWPDYLYRGLCVSQSSCVISGGNMQHTNQRCQAREGLPSSSFRNCQLQILTNHGHLSRLSNNTACTYNLFEQFSSNRKGGHWGRGKIAKP